MSVQIEKVLIDELVTLKILKHSKSSDEKDTVGQLHGFFADNVVEVTHTYPLADQNKIAISQSEYDFQMAKLSEEVHLDNNKVGWYHISYKSDSFVAFDSFEQQSAYQSVSPHSVYLVYDILAALRGVQNPFSAYRITEKYLELSEESVLPNNQIVDYCTKGGKIFTPIPVEIRRNPLAAAFVGQFTKQISKKYEQQFHPCINISNLLQKNSHYLNEAIEQLHEANYLVNSELLSRKPKDTKQDKEIESLKLIDNLLLMERVHTLTNNIIDESKFVAESTNALKQLS